MAEYAEKLHALLTEIDRKVEELATLRPFKPEDEDRLWQKLRLEWNYNSNHIEGNTLTYTETKSLFSGEEWAPVLPHTLRELDEMRAHDLAVSMIQQWATDPERELTEADIRALNNVILVKPFWKEALTPDGQSTRRLISVGKYKELPNSVLLANGKMFEYTAPERVVPEMAELMAWYRKEGSAQHAVVIAAMLHYRFVRIHPFDDGNGRLSRLLMNYHLLRCGFPPVIIKSADKTGYLFALQRADIGDIETFIEYIGRQLLWSLDLSIKAGKGESVEEEGDWEKQVDILARNAKSQKLHLSQQKETQQKALANWFSLNYPIIWKEFHGLFQPFDRFFRVAECNAYFHFADSEVVSSVESIHENWTLRAAEILDGTFKPFLDFSFFFKGSLYFEDVPDMQRISVKLTVFKDEGTVVMDRQIWNFYSSTPVTQSELAPLKEIAGDFLKKIEAIIQS